MEIKQFKRILSVFCLGKNVVYFLVRKDGLTPGHLTKVKEFMTEVQKAALTRI